MVLTNKKKSFGRQHDALMERIVRKSRGLVQKYSSYKEPSIGLDTAINPLEILDEGNGIDPLKASKAAILMENFRRVTMEMYGKGMLTETSRASLPAWVKNGLALIASAQAEDLVDRIISLQPMSNRLGRIHYLDTFRISKSLATSATPSRFLQ